MSTSRLRALLFPSALILLSCSSTKVEEGFYGKSRPKYAIERDKQGRKHGKETWWYANGRLKYEAFNRDGSREGKYTAWDSAGNLWYQGYEYHGKPESTLTYWYPDGKMKSQALFRDGIQLERKDWDGNGRLLVPRNARQGAVEAPEAPSPAGDAEAARRAALQVWAMRVRQTVEGYWRLPKELAARPLRSVSPIRASRDGRILEVTWLEKSPSAAFNSLAQQTFRKIKRLPPFPPEVKDESLDIQYEFVSQGRAQPRRRLETRGGSGAEGPAEEPGTAAPPEAPASD